MSDTYPVPGPLGNQPVVKSTFLAKSDDPRLPDGTALPAIIAFDEGGRLIAGAAKYDYALQAAYVQLTLIDPDSLETLAVFRLPEETGVGSGYRPAGAYFFLDDVGRVVIGTKDRTIWLVSHSRDGGTGRWSFHHADEDTYDLTGAIPDGDSIEALQPDASGRIWFTSKGGVVGFFDPVAAPDDQLKFTQELMHRGERIVNGHSADEDGGVYVVSTAAMYRFDEAHGEPTVSWREPYDAGTHVKQGQVDIGSGTTPTLMGRDFVTISDNGQPSMNVLVYRRGNEITGNRLVCKQPVFQPGNAANENSLIATDTSIIVENNFGYKDASKDTTHGHTTKPGIARVDLTKDTNGDVVGCEIRWMNKSVSIPSVISKMSLANGLIYTYTKPKGPATTDPWYFTAIDFRDGSVVYEQLAGTGSYYNNHYAGAYLGRNGALYVGVLGGVVAMRDGPWPDGSLAKGAKSGR